MREGVDCEVEVISFVEESPLELPFGDLNTEIQESPFGRNLVLQFEVQIWVVDLLVKVA